MNLVDKFVADIRKFQSANVFNPYRDACPEHDDLNSPVVRTENLATLLDAALRQNVRTIWFGRDLGYMGGRRTGLALTDEANLDAHGRMFAGVRFAKATVSNLVTERTAKIVWDQLSALDEPVLLWNIFPFHPHLASDPFSNRCHSRKERAAAEPFVRGLVNLLNADRLIAIGNDAQIGLTEMGLESIKVRHPSYGGKADFVRGISEVHSISHAQSAFTFH